MPDSLEGTSGGPVMIDSNGNAGTTKKFPNLLTAVSQIQRYAMIEREGGEIPVDFLTLEGQFSFFNVGMGSGLVHGLVFLLLLIIILPVFSDDILRAWVSRYVSLVEYKSFLFFIGLTPIVYSIAVCVYLTQYHLGKLTRRAIDQLLVGRLVSKIGQGLLYFVFFTVLANFLTPENTWKFAYNVTFRHYDIAQQIYRVIMNTRPNLHNAAFETLGVFMIAMAAPFVTIWMFGIYKKIGSIRQKIFWNR